jgi:hypothetical protein
MPGTVCSASRSRQSSTEVRASYRIGLDLMLAFLAPDDEAHTRRGGDAERHRWAAVRISRDIQLKYMSPVGSDPYPPYELGHMPGQHGDPAICLRHVIAS